MEAQIQRLYLNDALSQSAISDPIVFVLYRVEFTHRLLCSSGSLFYAQVLSHKTKCFNLVLFVCCFL